MKFNIFLLAMLISTSASALDATDSSDTVVLPPMTITPQTEEQAFEDVKKQVDPVGSAVFNVEVIKHELGDPFTEGSSQLTDERKVNP